jgi:hypothetical protein
MIKLSRTTLAAICVGWRLMYHCQWQMSNFVNLTSHGTMPRMFEKHPTLIPGRQRLSLFIGLILLSLVLKQFVELPTRTLTVTVLGSPLGFDLDAGWLMAVLLASLVCTGTDALVRTHPRAHEVSLRYTFVYWILPGLMGLAAARLLSEPVTRLVWVAGLAATGALLAIVLTAEYTTVDAVAPVYPQARLFLNVVAYTLAFVLFILVYQTRGRSLITATGMLVISFALALDLLWHAGAKLGQTFLLAAAVGLVMGEASWAMNYWQVSAWSGGMLLMLIFYVMTGMASQHLQGKLSRQVLFEFFLVAVVGTVVLMAFRP